MIEPRLLEHDHDEERLGFGEPSVPHAERRRRSPLEVGMLALAGLGAAALLAQSAGAPQAGTWLGFAASYGLLALGGAGFFWAELKDTEPGIKHDGVFFGGLSARGRLGWAAGLVFTAFYVVVYWFPAWLGDHGTDAPTGIVRTVDAPARALTGAAASRWFLYGVLYTLAIGVFGVRMLMKYRHSRYHRVRTLSVFGSQLILAWLLPNLLIKWRYPYMELNGVWPLKYDYLWPDKVGELVSAGTLGRWLLYWALAAILVATPVLTYLYGKRWYCSWVCGCGGLAETLGDPWRQLSSKSTDAWRIERVLVHSVLIVMLAATAVIWLDHELGWLGSWSGRLKQSYGFYIGAVFSGVVGVGFYPLLGSRVWCRFGCPQAAILGLIQRLFSRFRITTNGGQCMSCGNCSTYCEMGIDVRAYAERSENIVRASCVGCGVCASVCPRGVLKLEHGPPAERYPGAGAPLAGFVPSMQEVDIYGYEAWHAPEQPE